MMTDDVYWRVSVASLDRVIFDRPQDGVQMLALERKATLLNERGENRNPGPDSVLVRAQPFGGAVRIHGAAALGDVVGQLRFDSQRSRDEQDFRILIPSAAWAAVRQFCLRHLADPDDPILEADPSRELVEEFADAMRINLLPDQFRCQSDGFVIENEPSRTDNIHARGYPTVRIYRVFEIEILDIELRERLLDNSARCSSIDLQTLALADAAHGGRGRANGVLTMPLKRVTESYLALPAEGRAATIVIDGHWIEFEHSSHLAGDEGSPLRKSC